MKNKISVYWPLAIVGLLASIALVHIGGNVAARASQAPLDADHVTAELARAVSYGMIDAAAALPAKAIGVTVNPVAEAS